MMIMKPVMCGNVWSRGLLRHQLSQEVGIDRSCQITGFRGFLSVEISDFDKHAEHLLQVA